MQQGDKVRFTARLGLIESGGSSRFVAQEVEPGDEGEYVGPMPPVKDMTDWHLIAVLGRVPADPDKVLYCPCHSSQFELVS